MKQPLFERLVLSAIAIALCGSAAAVMPVAGWKGNFPSSAQDFRSLYLVPNSGNTVAADGSTITIGETKGFYLSAKATATAWPVTPVTVVAAVKNPQTGKPVLVAGVNGDNSRFGMMVNGENKLSGIWQSNEYAAVAPTIEVAADSSEIKYFGYAYDKASGSLLAYDGATQEMPSLVMGSYDIISVCLGSLYANTPATGAEYSAVFFFRTALSAEELAKWTTAPVTELTADRHVELVTDATVAASLSVLSLEITAPLALTIGEGAVLTAEGGVFANSKLTASIDCANRTTGYLIKGPIAGELEWTLENAPEGAKAVRTEGGLFYYDAGVHKVISLNFGATSATADSGLFPVAADAWVNNGSEKTGSSTSLMLGYNCGGARVSMADALDGASLEWSAGGVYSWTSATDYCLKSYLDDSNTTDGTLITLTGIPFETYDVYIYSATDTESRYFEPVKVAAYDDDEPTLVRYTVDTSGDVLEVEDTEGAGRWGFSQGKTSNLGRNVMRLPDLTGANLKINSKRFDVGNARAGIAAVQIVDRASSSALHEIRATLTADAKWSELEWSETVSDWTAQGDALIYLTNNGAEPIKITVDTPVSVKGVVLAGTGDIILEDDATPNLASANAIDGADFSGTLTRRWTGDLGSISFSDLCAKQPVSGIPNARQMVEIAGTATLTGQNTQTIPITVSGQVQGDSSQVMLAKTNSALFWVKPGGSFTANAATFLGQQNTSELRITGGSFNAAGSGYLYPNGGWGNGTYKLYISEGGSFTAPFRPYVGTSLTTNFKVEADGENSIFAPADLYTSSGNNDVATKREPSNFRVTLTNGGIFALPVTGVPNWLPVYATAGTGKIAVQEPETEGDLTLYCDLNTTENAATGNLSFDTGVKTVTLAGTWNGEGALTKLGTGTLALGTARPKLAGVAGNLSFTATADERLANKIQLPAGGDLSGLTLGQVSVVDSEGTAVEIESVTYDAETSLATIQFAARILEITESTNLADALNDATYDRVYFIGGDTLETRITITIDCELPADTVFTVRGNVQFFAAEGYAVPYGSLVYESGAALTATEVPANFTIPSGCTLRLVGGTAENPLAVAELTVSAGATLTIASGTTVALTGSQKISGTIVVEPGATLQLMTGDMLVYTANVVFHVYGTLDLGTWRQSVRAGMRFHFYGGATVKGYGDTYGAIDCYNAAHTESMQFHQYDGAETQDIHLYATYRMRMSVRMNVDAGVTVYCHKSSNGTDERPLIYDAVGYNNYNPMTKTGEGRLVLVGQELIPGPSSFSDNAWNDSSIFTAVFSNQSATVGTTLTGISYDANSVVKIDADRTIYVDKDFALPNNVHVTNGATLIFGHNDYNSNNDRNIVEGSHLEIDEGAQVLFGYWADYVQGYAELPSVTIDGAGLWGLYHEHATYLKVRGTVDGTAILDLNENSSGKIKVVNATGAINTPVKKTKGKACVIDTASEPGMSIYCLRNTGLMIIMR